MLDLVPASNELLDEIQDATYDIWSEGLSRRAYSQYYDAQARTAWGRRNLRRVAFVQGNTLVASAKVYYFPAALDGETIRLVGIGAVFTQPAHRGRGHARELLERILERETRDGTNAALLFSEIGAGYYARLGFEVVPRHDVRLTVTESPRGAPATLVRFGDDRDLENVVEMGRVRAQGFRFHLNRDADLVQYALAKKRLLAGLGPPGERELQFFVAEEGGNAVAYVVLTVHRGTWTLEEFGDRDPSGARVGAIMQVLLAREPAERRPPIRTWLPAGFRPPQILVQDERPSSEIMMIRGLSQTVPPLRESDVLYWRSDLF